MQEEKWKDVVGYESLYKVSDLGRVRRLSRESVDKLGRPYKLKEKLLKPNRIKGGYFQLKLTRDKVEKCLLLHRLVCEAFHGPAPKGKDFVNHKDGDKSNNRADNLEWCTFQENMNHAASNGLRARGVKSHTNKLSEDQVLEICKLWDSGGLTKMDLAYKYQVGHSNIRSILSGNSWNWLTNRRKD